MQLVERLLDLSGIGRARTALRWVSAAEGQRFAETVTELTASTAKLGSFDPGQYKLPLAAIESALKSPKLRWLVGMDRHLTERGNVYQEKVDEDRFSAMFGRVAEEEYQEALIAEVLKDGPRSVREIAGIAGLPVYAVSIRLNNLERCGRAELHGYDGATPKFMSLPA
jgi:F420-non-reducing hydrogenase iron-sulfur subunit